MTAADHIRNRIAEKQEEYAEYLSHAKLRLREEDLHGLWDCGANASEVSNYIDGLEFALAMLEGDVVAAAPRPKKQRMWVQDGYLCVQGADPVARFDVRDVFRMLDLAVREEESRT